MGCTTNGFIKTKEKDPFKIWHAIKWSLFEEMKKESGIDDVRAVWGSEYKMPVCEVVGDGYLLVRFRFADEQRDMSVHLDCDNDYSWDKNGKGKKIIVTLGAWGRSVQLVECVLNGMSEFGHGFICENDCKDESFRSIKA